MPSDLVELTRESMDATNRGELNAAATMFAPDAVFDVSCVGLGRFEGADAIHGYLADWTGAYEEQEMRAWEGRDLSTGVVFAVALFEARPLGSDRTVSERWAFTVTWEDELIASMVADVDISEGRRGAERLAESRG